ncbi:MAG TPA: efflux RND transporter periplasmic adaptor subunit [Acidobacteriaceae bacterium]|nr:efflux RND transporter periplasmic adaptor subunit [Acidobacteriaceae bacterium]
MHRKRTVSIAAALCFMAVACKSNNPSATENTTPPASVVAVTRATLANTLTVAGEFLPYQEVELHAKVAGYIRRINVDIGDKVKAGQVLATLDVPELQAQVQGAQAGVRQTQAQILRAKNDAARAEANYAAVHSAAQRLKQASDARPGLIAQQELDDAQAKDQESAAQVDAAKSAFEAMQQQLGVSQAQQQQVSSMADYSRITAPFDGIVTWRYADTGALIQAGTSNAGSAPVVKIAQVSTLRLRLPVPGDIVPFVHDGDSAIIHIGALNRTIVGKVNRSTGALDPATRTMQVEVDVPNRDGSLAPGMYAEVTLNVRRSGDALVVPVQAIDRSEAQPVVLVVDGQNRVEKRTVQTGITTANRVEVVSGVHEGEQVIVANQSSFQPGELVSPKESSIIAAEVK